MRMPRLTDYDVDRRLGYSPCVCGIIDGTWHTDCYRGRTKEQIVAGYKRAYQIARAHIHTQDALNTNAVIEKARKQS